MKKNHKNLKNINTLYCPLAVRKSRGVELISQGGFSPDSEKISLANLILIPTGKLLANPLSICVTNSLFVEIYVS